MTGLLFIIQKTSFRLNWPKSLLNLQATPVEFLTLVFITSRLNFVGGGILVMAPYGIDCQIITCLLIENDQAIGCCAGL